MILLVLQIIKFRIILTSGYLYNQDTLLCRQKNKFEKNEFVIEI